MNTNKKQQNRRFNSILVALLPALAFATFATGCGKKSNTKKTKKAQIEARTAKVNDCEAKLKACIDPYMECIGNAKSDEKKNKACEATADKCFKGIEESCSIDGLDLGDEDVNENGCGDEGDEWKDEEGSKNEKEGEDDDDDFKDEESDDQENPEDEFEDGGGCVDEEDLVDDENEWIQDLADSSKKAINECLKKYSDCESKDGASGAAKCLDALEACVLPHLKEKGKDQGKDKKKDQKKDKSKAKSNKK